MTISARSAVRRAVECGAIIKGEDGLIDPEQADRDWLSTSTPRPRLATRKPQPEGDVSIDLHQAKLMKETAQAKLAKLDYENKSGELAPIVAAVAGGAYAGGIVATAGGQRHQRDQRCQGAEDGEVHRCPLSLERLVLSHHRVPLPVRSPRGHFARRSSARRCLVLCRPLVLWHQAVLFAVNLVGIALATYGITGGEVGIRRPRIVA